MSKKSDLIRIVADALDILYPDKFYSKRDASILIKILAKHPEELKSILPVHICSGDAPELESRGSL